MIVVTKPARHRISRPIGIGMISMVIVIAIVMTVRRAAFELGAWEKGWSFRSGTAHAPVQRASEEASPSSAAGIAIQALGRSGSFALFQQTLASVQAQLAKVSSPTTLGKNSILTITDSGILKPTDHNQTQGGIGTDVSRIGKIWGTFMDLNDNVAVNGKLDLSGKFTANGGVQIGDSGADELQINSSLVSSVVPKTTNSIDLGSTTYRFRTGYFTTSLVIGSGTTTITGTDLTTTNLTVTNLTVASLNSTSAADVDIRASGDNDITVRAGDGASDSTADGNDLFVSAEDSGSFRFGDFSLTVSEDAAYPLTLRSSSGGIQLSTGSTDNGNLTLYSAGTLTLDSSANNTTILLQAGTGGINLSAGTMRLTGNLIVTGTETFNGVAYTFPGADGSNSNVLTTNGSGLLSWAAGGGGGFTDSGTYIYPTNSARKFIYGYEGQLTGSGYFNAIGNDAVVLRAGQAALDTSTSGATSTTADIQLAAADALLATAGTLNLLASNDSTYPLILRSSQGGIQLSTQSTDNGNLTLYSSGTLTLDTSRNNTNILMKTGTGNITISTGTLTMTGLLDIRDSTGTLALATDANGNVGIGTTSPSGNLHVVSTTDYASAGSEMVTNGSFTGNATGWTLGAGGGSPDWYYNSNNVSHGAGGSGVLQPSTPLSVTVGASYLVSFDISNYSSGYILASIGLAQTRYVYYNVTGYNEIIVAEDTSNLKFTPSSFVGTIDNVSVTRITPVPPTLTLANNGGTSSPVELRSGGDTVFSRYNTFVGDNVGQHNTEGGNNTALGWNALFSNTTGGSNAAVGTNALFHNTDGGSNTAVGDYTLYSNNSGGSNTALGWGVLASNTIGNYNSAIGNYALYWNGAGSYNAVLGEEAGQGFSQFNGEISNSVLVGYKAGYTLKTGGDNNILIGYQAGDALTTGSSNIVIGYNIDAPSATSTQTLNIGNLIFATGLNGTGTTVSTGNVGIGTTGPLYTLDVSGGTRVIGDAGVLLRAGRSSINLSSGTTSTTADLQLATADQMDLFAGRFSLTTSSATAGDVKIDSAGTLTLSTSRNNTNIILSPGTGNVGIGTAAPAGILDTIGNAPIILRAGQAALNNSTSGATSTTADIQLAAADALLATAGTLNLLASNDSTYPLILRSSQGGIQLSTQSTDNGNLTLYSSGTLTLDTSRNNTNILFLPGTGNVGIGTTSPGQLLDLAYGNLRFTTVTAPGAPSVALAGAGAGNVDNGDHDYAVTFVTASGETELGTYSTVTVSDKTTNGKVSVTNIPTGPTGVTARKIYRSRVSDYGFVLITTINDNTTTTYTDNTADNGSAVDNINRGNTTSGAIYVGTTRAGFVGIANPSYQTAFGGNALNSTETGYYNSAFGWNTLHANTTGYGNTAMGMGALQLNTNGYGNTAVGVGALQNLTGGINNVAVGGGGNQNLTGTGNVFLGYSAGYYETGSNKLFIDNAPRSSESDGRAKALIYGIFDAAVANQYVTINGQLQVTGTGSSYLTGNVGVGNTVPKATLDAVGNNGVILRAGQSAITLSSGTTSTTADLELAAADQIDLFAGRFSLTTSSGTAGDVKIDSAGTLTLSTSRNNTNINILTGSGKIGVNMTAAPSYTLDVSGTGRFSCANDFANVSHSTFCSDVAETYETNDPTLEPGDVLVIDTSSDTKVAKSQEEYDPKTVGVYSTSPGLLVGGETILGGTSTTSTTGTTSNTNDGKKVPVALVGRVPVKIARSSQPIAVGDFLTSSDTEPGKAMKATRAGYTVGKALESWQPCNNVTMQQCNNIEKIIAFVNLGWADPTNALANFSMSLTSTGDIVPITTESTTSSTRLHQGYDGQASTTSSTGLEMSTSSVPLATQSVVDSLTQRVSLLEELVYTMSGSNQVNRLQATGSESTASDSASPHSVFSIQNSEFDPSSDPSSDLQLSGNLTVLGSTNLADTTIGGKFIVGVITVDDIGGSIDALGTALKIQPSGLADVEFMGGKIIVTKAGDLEIKTGMIAGNSSFRDAVVMPASPAGGPAGQGSLRIDTSWKTAPTTVTVTPTWNTTVWVEDLSLSGFTIHVGASPSAPAKLFWLAIW